MTAELGFFAAMFLCLSLISPATVPGETGPSSAGFLPTVPAGVNMEAWQ